MESMAPDLMRLSSARPFTTPISTRSQKSKSPVNGPSSSRASTMLRIAFSPTFLTAFRPNRMRSSTTRKPMVDSLMSGGSTSMPMSLATLT